MNSRSKIPVLILTSSFPRWPNDTDPPFVYQLAERISDRFDITVLAPHCHGARRCEQFGHLRVVRFKYFFEKYQKLAYQGGILGNLKSNPSLYLQVPLFFIFEWLALIRLIRKLKPNVIHAHWIIPQGLIAVVACRFLARPPKILCTAHCADVYGLGDPISKMLRRFVLNNTDTCTAVSTAMKKDIARDGAKSLSIEVIPMGVDLKNRFVPGGNGRVRHQLLFVGRLVEKKGLEYLLAAMPVIRQSYPDISLVIIGDGHRRQGLQQYATDNGLDGCVAFIGAIPNKEIVTYYQKAELVIFPSVVARNGDREGLGLVPVEAMGCGCGVITTDLNAIKDVVANGINGIVVPQRSARSIADAVMNMFRNRSMLERYRQKGIQTVREKFDWEVIAEKYRTLIQTLVDQPYR
jgi:glycosyltransferase involved in cell wall biosynthesis